jgi:hypothetical protein
MVVKWAPWRCCAAAARAWTPLMNGARMRTSRSIRRNSAPAGMPASPARPRRQLWPRGRRLALTSALAVSLAGLGLAASPAVTASAAAQQPSAVRAATATQTTTLPPGRWELEDTEIPNEADCIVEGEANVASGIAVTYKCESYRYGWELYIYIQTGCPTPIQRLARLNTNTSAAC